MNFDENLSRAIGAELFGGRSGFTDYYPWGSYFSDREITSARQDFAIWHAHGMRHYSRSIRLGLTHYMGSVQRARQWVYGDRGLRASAKGGGEQWRGSDSWLDVFFFCPLLIAGWAFGKDETFLRWLFLERARLHKLRPEWKREAYFVVKQASENEHRKPFFDRLGIRLVVAEDYAEIYENAGWNH